MQTQLEKLIDNAYVSVENLRRIAHVHCGAPQDIDTGLLDLWLYERLATAAHLAGVHFSLMQDESVLSMIDFSLQSSQGTFEERCKASLDEVIANPIVRHEIAMPEASRFWELGSDRKFWSMRNTPEHYMSGAMYESWCDTHGFFAQLLAQKDDE